MKKSNNSRSTRGAAYSAIDYDGETYGSARGMSYGSAARSSGARLGMAKSSYGKRARNEQGWFSRQWDKLPSMPSMPSMPKFSMPSMFKRSKNNALPEY